MATRMQQRRATASEWATANPVLAAGEIGFETDTLVIKLGDGVTSWSQLVSGYLRKNGGETILASAVGVVPLTLKGIAGQTADIVRAELADGTAVRVSNTGELLRNTDPYVLQTAGDARYLLKAQKAADADLLDGRNLADASTVNTVVGRDAAGDINVRLVRSEYDVTNSTINFVMTQVDTASNNYIRPSTIDQLRDALVNSRGFAETFLHGGGVNGIA